MEEERKNVIDGERNIFYEYFSRLACNRVVQKDFCNKLEKLHSETFEAYYEILELAHTYENLYEYVNGDISYNNVHDYIKRLYEQLSDKNIYLRFIRCFNKELTLYIDFIESYNFTPYSKFAILLKKMKGIRHSLENRTDTQFLGFGFIFSACNFLDHLFNIIPLILNQRYRSIYNKGCNILKLDIYKFIEIVYKGLKDIIDILKLDFSGIKSDILIITQAYLASQIPSGQNENDVTHILKIRKYLPFAEYAYNDGYVTISNSYLPIQDHPILKTDKRGFFKLGMMYACLFENSKNNEIIIAFCGTVLNFSKRCLKTVLTDLSQLANIGTSYINAAGVVVQIMEDYPNKEIIVCGHSLGGGLSQFASAPHKDSVEAYCFNSAGLVGVCDLINKVKKNNKIHHYRLKNDFVSRFGILIGDVYTIKYPRPCYKSHGIDAIKDAIK